MQYSVHAPSQFIYTHRNQLLPNWSCPIASVLLVLQPCEIDLLRKNLKVAVQKDRLRQRFLRFGYSVATQLEQLGHCVAIFDPKTGFPWRSPSGSIPLDDVAVARTCLGYRSVQEAGCSVLLHPTWGSAVYPSTLLSSAEPEVVKTILRTSLSECHHSLTVCGSFTE